MYVNTFWFQLPSLKLTGFRSVNFERFGARFGWDDGLPEERTRAVGLEIPCGVDYEQQVKSAA